MPIVQALMDNLVKRYGPDEGKKTYYSMEATAKGPFAKGARHHAEHLAFAKQNGIPPASPAKKKARLSKKGGPRRR